MRSALLQTHIPPRRTAHDVNSLRSASFPGAFFCLQNIFAGALRGSKSKSPLFAKSFRRVIKRKLVKSKQINRPLYIYFFPLNYSQHYGHKATSNACPLAPIALLRNIRSFTFGMDICARQQLYIRSIWRRPWKCRPKSRDGTSVEAFGSKVKDRGSGTINNQSGLVK